MLILACFAAVSSFGATPDPVASNPNDWVHWYTTPHQPAHKAFLGITKQLSVNKYLVWAKAEFLKPQHAPAGNYTVEVVLLEIRCDPPDFTVMREMRYSENYKLISDVRLPYGKKTRPYPVTDDPIDLGALPLVVGLAETAFLNTRICIVGD